MLHVHPDLMRAAGMYAELHPAEIPEVFEHLVFGYGWLSFFVDGHQALPARVLHDACFNGSLGYCRLAHHQAKIILGNIALFENPRKLFMGGLIFCKHYHTRGLTVEAVYGKDFSKLLLQPYLQRWFLPCPVGNCKQSRRLVHDNKILTVLNDIFSYIQMLAAV